MNKVILCGRLTAKPELRYTGSNKPYARFTLAVNRPRIKDKEQEVDFINCIAWRNTAEFVNKYFDKGQEILISGRIQNSTYEDKDGNKRTNTDIVVEEVKFVGSKKQETKKETTNDVWEDFGNDIDNFLE